MKPHFKAIGAGLALAAILHLGATLRAADPTPVATPTPTPTEAPLHKVGGSDDIGIVVDSGEGTHASHHHTKGDDRVSIMGSVEVRPDEEVNGSAVAVLGSVAVNGVVDEDAVSVMGSNTINGTVHGNAVSVLGNLHLGPNARVDGDVVCVGGHYTRDASASVGGTEVEKKAGSDFSEYPQVHAWLNHSLRMGRPFSIGEHSFGIWMVGLLMFALCILLALAFPAGVTKCGDTLAHRPGITFLTGILALLALPVLFVLLLITVVGILVLPLCVAGFIIFGKAAIYALVGRSIVGKQHPVVIATLVGGVLFTLFYFVPFLGGALWLLTSFLGFACVLTTLYTTATTPAAAAVVAAPASPVAPAAAAAPVPAAAETAQPPVTAADPLVPPALSAVAESGLPRAGFWVRMIALLIDVILVGVVTHMSGFFLPCLAIYGAVLWKLRGSTVGGIIFGLKVVRVDGRPMEWVTTIVRGLACFFSLIVVGLGFFWIGFDREKQGWHDKIAGTVVVRTPKAISLV